MANSNMGAFFFGTPCTLIINKSKTLFYVQEPRCQPRVRPRPPQGECLTSAQPSTSSGPSDTGRGSTGAAGEMLSSAIIFNFASHPCPRTRVLKKFLHRVSMSKEGQGTSEI